MLPPSKDLGGETKWSRRALRGSGPGRGEGIRSLDDGTGCRLGEDLPVPEAGNRDSNRSSHGNE